MDTLFQRIQEKLKTDQGILNMNSEELFYAWEWQESLNISDDLQ